jgi:hypothetical protein
MHREQAVERVPTHLAKTEQWSLTTTQQFGKLSIHPDRGSLTA